MELEYIQSYKRNLYNPLIKGLYKEFGQSFVSTIDCWCEVLPPHKEGNYWEVWLILLDKKVVGICGLYSLTKGTRELWLGWFGVLPKVRSLGIGTEVLQDFLIPMAILIGAKYIYSYVDEGGAPLQFYYRNGFKRVGTVKEYCTKAGLSNHFIKNNFESLKDHVIKLKLC